MQLLKQAEPLLALKKEDGTAAKGDEECCSRIWRNKEADFPPRALEGAQACQHLDVGS